MSGGFWASIKQLVQVHNLSELKYDFVGKKCETYCNMVVQNFSPGFCIGWGYPADVDEDVKVFSVFQMLFGSSVTLTLVLDFASAGTKLAQVLIFLS